MFDRFMWCLVVTGPEIQYWTEDFVFHTFAGSDCRALEELLRLTRDLEYRIELCCQLGVRDRPGMASTATPEMPQRVRYVPILVGGGGSAGKMSLAHLPVVRFGNSLLARTFRLQQSRRAAMRRRRSLVTPSSPLCYERQAAAPAADVAEANPLSDWWEPQAWMREGGAHSAVEPKLGEIAPASHGTTEQALRVPCVSPLQLDCPH